jgi:glycosyltransferase involved in cell wall biosynthesis
MKVLMAHPTGNSNVRAIATALKHASLLAEFNTTIAINSSAKWLNLMPASIKDQLLRRQFALEAKDIKAHPYREIARIVLPKIGFKKFVVNERSWAGIDAVYKNFDKRVAKRLEKSIQNNDCTAVYAYEDGALDIFKKAKQHGLMCIYDLPIAYWETSRRLMLEEAARLPAWSMTLAGGISDSGEKLERKTEEMALADIIVAPGGFVFNSLPSFTENKLVIVSPFGSPPVKIELYKRQAETKTNKLRVLFVGSMTQRKGLGDLFEAIKFLNNPGIELLVMGSPVAPMKFYHEQLASFTYLPNRPHDQVLDLMRSCDVFCLPSIVEGRALVMQEAMSQGLPLIITKNTGGEDLIIEGKTGFLVPIRSPQMIAEKLQWFFDNRVQLETMGKAAQNHASIYTWEKYGATIISALLKITN